MSNLRLLDLRAREGLCKESSSDKYEGAKLFKDLKTYTMILNSTLKCTGSQCREAKTGVIWVNFGRPIKSLADAFWNN